MLPDSKFQQNVQYVAAGLLIVFAVIFLIERQDWPSIACVALLIVLAKLDTLKTIAVGPKDGIKAEFSPKIIENIQENHDPITTTTYASYRQVEDRVTQDIIKKYDRTARVSREYALGNHYRADVFVESEQGNAIYEIKYVRNLQSAKAMVSNAVKQLHQYGSLANNAKLYLVLASEHQVNVDTLHIPDDITVEYFKV